MDLYEPHVTPWAGGPVASVIENRSAPADARSTRAQGRCVYAGHWIARRSFWKAEPMLPAPPVGSMVPVVDGDREPSTDVAPARVLVVDDNPLIVRVIESLLMAEQCEVVTAANGEQARDVLERQEVELIICDVMMPDCDGHELHRWIRENQRLAHVPFIFLTALGDEEQVQRAKEQGVDDYLVKPFDPRHLTAVVRGKLARVRAQRSAREEEYNAYRKRIIHTLSHEFRTPLVAINTGAELLLEQPQLDVQRAQALVEAIQRGGKRLERLINDFMLLQQVEAGLAERVYLARRVRMPLKGFLERVVEAASVRAREDGHTLVVHELRLQAEGLVYEPQLQEALLRLIDNGFKFQRSDAVVELSAYESDGWAILEVNDRGIGLDPAHAEEVMEAFSQVDRDKLEQQGGGLGLAIASRYVKIHGGQLRFAPREGGGTVVQVKLPLCE